MAVLVVGGCVHPRAPLVVTDPDPSVKIPATFIAVRGHDRSAVPQLIKDLESDDPAVRLYASHALEKLTDQTFGYHYYDEDEGRAQAVARWKKWYSQQIEPTSDKVKPATTATAQGR